MSQEAKRVLGKKTGRQPETPMQRLERAKRDVKLAARRVIEAERTKFATIGEAVMAEAVDDAELMTRLRDIIRRRVVSKTGKQAVAPVLMETQQGADKSARAA